MIVKEKVQVIFKMSYKLQSTKPALHMIGFNSRSILRWVKASGDAYTYGLFWKLGVFLEITLSSTSFAEKQGSGVVLS